VISDLPCTASTGRQTIRRAVLHALPNAIFAGSFARRAR